MQINSDHKWLKRVIRGQSSWIFVFLITIFWKPSRRLQKSNKINNFALASRFFVPFFAVAARFSYTTRMCRISRRGKTQDNYFLFLSFFFPLTSMQTLGFNPWKICKHLTIWRRRDNREFTFKWQVQLRHVIYVWLVILSYLFLILVPNMVLNVTSNVQSKHMTFTRFNPLWVSGPCYISSSWLTQDFFVIYRWVFQFIVNLLNLF